MPRNLLLLLLGISRSHKHGGHLYQDRIQNKPPRAAGLEKSMIVALAVKLLYVGIDGKFVFCSLKISAPPTISQSSLAATQEMMTCPIRPLQPEKKNFYHSFHIRLI